MSSGVAIALAISGGALVVTDGGSWSGPIDVTGGIFDAFSGFAIGSALMLGNAAEAEVDSGTLSVGSGTFAGTISGAGELELAGGGQFTLQTGISLAVATIDLDASATLDAALEYAGEFVLDGSGNDAAALLLNGNSIGLLGPATLDGTASGPGTIDITDVADLDGFLLSGPATLEDSGTITQDGAVTLGSATSDASTLQIESGAIYDILADTGIAASPSASIDNAGLLEKTRSNGSSVIAADLSSTGTVDVAMGLLSLTGGNTSLGGAVTGAGTLELGPGGDFTLAAGLDVPVGTLELGAAAGLASSTTLASSLSYAGSFVLARLDGSAATLELNGNSLALGGHALLNGEIDAASGGTITVSGWTDVNGLVLSGAASLVDAATFAQDGVLVLENGGSSTTTVQIAAGATYEIVADIGVAVTGTAQIDNSGLFEKIGALGISTIAGDFDNAGTVLAERGTLFFADGTIDTLGGTLAGAGEIDFAPSGTATLENNVVLSVATLGLYDGDVVLSADETYAGDFIFGSAATLTPNGFVLTLSGAAALGGLQDGGAVTVTGSADANGLTLAGSATLDVTGVASQDGTVTLGTADTDAAGIVIAAGATYDILADVNINSLGDAAISNAGLLEKTGAIGMSYVFANITNIGTIMASLGTLSLLSGLATWTATSPVREKSISTAQAPTRCRAI